MNCVGQEYSSMTRNFNVKVSADELGESVIGEEDTYVENWVVNSLITKMLAFEGGNDGNCLIVQ